MLCYQKYCFSVITLKHIFFPLTQNTWQKSCKTVSNILKKRSKAVKGCEFAYDNHIYNLFQVWKIDFFKDFRESTVS